MNTRPAFVLCFAADMQGCGMHRIAVPLGTIVDAGVADGRIDMQLWPVEVAAAAKPDVIVWQRQVEDSQIEAMKRYREAMPDTLFIYELDDYIGEVPAASFHAGFMPPNLAEQVAKGIAICDRMTTTTEPLARWLRELGGKDVRVVPNALPQNRIKERKDRPESRGQKLRIGFAGGISHAGDLELLRHAMTEIGDAVQWVFMGMQPKNPPVQVEFHEGVQPMAYMDALAALDLDLILAPLEDNRFNRCKSNLRLLEAGAVGACVIAQRLDPYMDGVPPAFSYAETPEEWTEAIREFIAVPGKSRRKMADNLRAWVGQRFTLEKQLPARVAAWLPDGAWRPVQAKDATEEVILAGGEKSRFLRRAPAYATLVEACENALLRGANVLWRRPTTVLNEKSWNALRTALIQDASVASVVALASDGPNSFPRTDAWTPVSEPAAEAIAAGAKTILRDRKLMLPAPTGPCILLSRTALAMGGIPDVAGCEGNEEVAILEWGLRLAARGWRHMQAADAFACSAMPPVPPTQSVGVRFQARSYISHVRAPLEELSARERSELELHLLRSQWGGLRPGVPGFGNDYASWSALRDAQRQVDFSVFDNNRLCAARPYGPGSSDDNEWVIFLDAGVLPKKDMLLRFEAVISTLGPEVVAVYADHENKVGDQIFPDFKPDFDRELFLARDYVMPVCAVRTSWLNGESLEDPAELYIKLLREPSDPVHIPEVLATVELDPQPESHALAALGRQILIQQYLGDAVTVTASRQMLGSLVVRYDWRHYRKEAPKISIIIPTTGTGRLIQPCVNTLLQHTKYPNFEVVVVQNGPHKVCDIGMAAHDPRVKVVHWKDGFNWSEINNWAVDCHADGEFLLFMNDDVQTSSMEGDWLDLMLGRAVQDDIGAVGARLIHPSGVLQHVGVVVHNGIAGHMHKGLPNGHPGNGGLAVLSHEASAVTGACMLVSREKFEQVNGFEEALSHNYNDTDFCMKLRKDGLRNVVEMGAELLHAEGTTRESPSTPAGAERLLRDNVLFADLWHDPDPYWNPNMALGLAQGGLGIQGLNCDVLAWQDTPPAENALRVLLINDAPGKIGRAYAETCNGTAPFLADMSGFQIRLTVPNAFNTPPWDIRRPTEFARSMKHLGIDRIVLCSLVGGAGAAPPVEALRFLGAIGVPVALLLVPGGHLLPFDGDEDTFGAVDKTAWLAAYDALIGADHAEAAQ